MKSKECSERNYKHGKSNIDYPLYKTWCNIKARCYTSSSTQFKDYGGRGIKVCDKWREDFKIFESWALSNGYQEDLTIERINFNGNYEPCNCRWISIKEQQKNKRDNIIITAWNETKILSDWIMDNRCKTRQQTISLRIKRGWFPEKAISTETNYRSERNEFIRLKNIWKGIIGRCYNLNHISYKYFGAKGIKLCNEWKDNFPQFLHWSLLNGYNSDKSIDRLNINGDYCPFNCRWATTKEQSRNKSNNIKITAWKECKVLADWLKDNRCKVGHKVIVYRLNNGWNPEEAISTLPYKKRLI